ncbi:hypothetical protein CMK12_13315 [Candidatus Poribacteria bacterium]|nr:hypothetical protein [Candidatus Poribacteria bacterium]
MGNCVDVTIAHWRVETKTDGYRLAIISLCVLLILRWWHLLADKNNLPKLKKLRLKNFKLPDEQVSALQKVHADLEIAQ